jgi:DNA-directed RNA polymerase specialized sigma24 family protein
VRDGTESFEVFFREYFEQVLGALTIALRQPVLAEESARETFTRAYMQWARVRRVERPATWLYVTASRHALRRGLPERSAAPATAAPDTFERAIEDLGERERLAIVLHHHAGLSTNEMARALRCSPEAAAATLREAYRHLGVERADDDDIPEVELDAP